MLANTPKHLHFSTCLKSMLSPGYIYDMTWAFSSPVHETGLGSAAIMHLTRLIHDQPGKQSAAPQQPATAEIAFPLLPVVKAMLSICWLSMQCKTPVERAETHKSTIRAAILGVHCSCRQSDGKTRALPESSRSACQETCFCWIDGLTAGTLAQSTAAAWLTCLDTHQHHDVLHP